ncbi:hypothetical protein [Rheinheimera sp.]|uniref:hypothetical protein n=1 Tax=Rheinheimera sp. TaxID=1869214 RepID=UPI0027B891FA|nr:hypothetical protein [Rheinheimera sp.]
MAATFILRDDQLQVAGVTVLSVLLIAFLGRNKNAIYPTLAIVLFIRFAEFLLGFLLMDSLPLTYLLVTGLVDLLFAFLLVHYHMDPALHKLFKSQPQRGHYPQVYLIAFLLAFSSLYHVLGSAELMIHLMDKTVFGENIPFFFSTGPIVAIGIRLLVDLTVWSLLLAPGRIRLPARVQRWLNP